MILEFTCWRPRRSIPTPTQKNSFSFIVLPPCDTLWGALMLLLLFSCIKIAQEHLRSNVLPDTTMIRLESATGYPKWKTHCTKAIPTPPTPTQIWPGLQYLVPIIQNNHIELHTWRFDWFEGGCKVPSWTLFVTQISIHSHMEPILNPTPKILPIICKNMDYELCKLANFSVSKLLQIFQPEFFRFWPIWPSVNFQSYVPSNPNSTIGFYHVQSQYD